MKNPALCFLCVLLFNLSGSAATYYVATTGNDSADGSIGTPWLRITNSLPKIAGGDTLNIRAGTYGEWIANTIPSGASWETATVLQSYNGETVILNPATPTVGDDIIRIVGTNKHHIIINGLILDGVNLTNGANCVKITYSVDGQPAQYIRFSNCTITNAYDAMNVLISANGNYTPTYCEFTNCIIAYAARSGDDTPPKHGIYVSTSSNTFDRCTVFGNQTLGFHFYDGLPSGNIVRNCIFPGVGGTNQAIGLYGGTNNQIYNNVFYDNFVAILLKPLQAADDTLIAFNTFYSNGLAVQVFNADAILGDVTIQNNIVSESYLTNYGAVHLTPGVGTNSTVTVRNNVMQGEGLPGRVFMDADTAATFSDNLTNRFLAGFVNPIARDFTLQSGGPAVSAGIATAGITNDFASVTRGSPPDLGAYEFIAGVVSSDIPGTVVAAKITSGNTVNTFSIGDSDEMKGTPKTVSFLSQLDLIPAERRSEGMEAWVLETRKAYRLVGGTNNSNWEPLALTEGGVLTAAGADTELQYNSDGIISGATGLVWNATTGFFGVGTNNPQARLHIAGDIIADGYGASGRLTVTRDGGYPVYLASGNSQSSRLHTQNGFWLEENSGQKMLYYNTVDAQPIISFNYNSNNFDTEIKGQTNVLLYADASAGLVGIGTTNPAYQLHVVGTNRADYFLGNGALLTGLPAGSVQTNISYTAVTNAPWLNTAGGEMTGPFTNTASGVSTVIRSNTITTGNTTNSGHIKAATMSTTGNVTFAGNGTVSGKMGIGMASGTPGLSVGGPSGGVSLSLSDLVNSTMTVSHPVGGAIRLQTGGGSSAFEFYTSVERMKLTGPGFLGIGMTPVTLLDVNGSIRGTNFVGNGAGLSNAVDITATGGATITWDANKRTATIDVSGGGGSITNFGVTGSGANTATTNGTVVDIFTSGLDPRFTSSAGTITSGSNTFAATTIVATKIFTDEVNATNSSSLVMTAAGQTLNLGSSALTLSGSAGGFIGVGSGLTGITFDQLSDVTITSAAAGHAIGFNGTVWTNGPASVGGGSGAAVDSAFVTIGTPVTGLTGERALTGTANEITITDNGANSTAVLSLPASIDLGGKTSFEIPNAAAPTVDAFGEIAGDNNLWAASRGAPVFFDGTAVVALIGTLASDAPSNLQVPTYNSGNGTITWETPSAVGFPLTTSTTIGTNFSGGIQRLLNYTEDGSGFLGLQWVLNSTLIDIYSDDSTIHFDNHGSALWTFEQGVEINGTVVSPDKAGSGDRLAYWDNASGSLEASDVGVAGGTITATTINTALLNMTNFSVYIAAGTTLVGAGGTLKVDTTSNGNVGAGEDNLTSYTIPASALATNGQYLEFNVWGTCAANTNPKQIKIVYGATTLIDTTSVVLNGNDWRGHGVIVRTGATTQTATAEFTVGGTLLSAVNGTITDTTAPGETLSGTSVFKCTGTSTVAPADNDIAQKGLVIKWYPASQ